MPDKLLKAEPNESELIWLGRIAYRRHGRQQGLKARGHKADQYSWSRGVATMPSLGRHILELHVFLLN